MFGILLLRNLPECRKHRWTGRWSGPGHPARRPAVP